MTRTRDLQVWQRQRRTPRSLPKLDRVTRFAIALPKLRSQVDRDLRRRRSTQDRVTACVIHRVDEELARWATLVVAREARSDDIVTIARPHIVGQTTYVDFNVRRMNGPRRYWRVDDVRGSTAPERLATVPLLDLFHFLDDDEIVQDLRSDHVNAYVKRHMGEEFGARDFRTWGGTVAIVAVLCSPGVALRRPEGELASERQDTIISAAERFDRAKANVELSYVDPRALDSAAHPEVLATVRGLKLRPRRHFAVDEQRTLALLNAMTP